MIECWRITRELNRIAQQVVGWALQPVELVRRNLLQRIGPAFPTLEIGQGEKVAIFVIYQPIGVAESTIRTLEHLVENGFATIVISNARLLPCDRAAMTDRAAFVLERPNFGYDFGAYKDAVCALPDMGRHHRCLLLLNDSVWFPATRNPVLLHKMERHEADVLAAQIFGEALLASDQASRRMPILGSYFLLFKQRALQHQAFRDFWRRYRMSSNKEITLRRGERGLSDALFGSDLRCAGIYNQASFEAAVMALDSAGLRDCLADLVVLDPRLRRQRAKLLTHAESVDWQDRCRHFVLAVSKSKNFIGSSPLLSYRTLGVEVVKKNNEMLYRLARRNLVRGLRNSGDTLLDRRVRAELEGAVRRDRLPPPFCDTGALP